MCETPCMYTQIICAWLQVYIVLLGMAILTNFICVWLWPVSSANQPNSLAEGKPPTVTVTYKEMARPTDLWLRMLTIRVSSCSSGSSSSWWHGVWAHSWMCITKWHAQAIMLYHWEVVRMETRLACDFGHSLDKQIQAAHTQKACVSSNK